MQRNSEPQMDTERDPAKDRFAANPKTTRVAAMTINPYLLHVYWQIPVEELEELRSGIEKSWAVVRPVLRLYDITYILFDGTNANRTFDIEVDFRTMKWNVPLWSSNKSYVIDLGYKATDGRFFQIARSNIVHVPRAAPSPRFNEQDTRIESEKSRRPVPPQVAHVSAGKQAKWPVQQRIRERGQGAKEILQQDKGSENALDPAQRPYHPPDLIYVTGEGFSFGISSPSPSSDRGTIS